MRIMRLLGIHLLYGGAFAKSEQHRRMVTTTTTITRTTIVQLITTKGLTSISRQQHLGLALNASRGGGFRKSLHAIEGGRTGFANEHEPVEEEVAELFSEPRSVGGQARNPS